MPKPDTLNRYMVATQGESIFIKHPPLGAMNEALGMAAWLVALADEEAGADESEFTEHLKAVLEM